MDETLNLILDTEQQTIKKENFISKLKKIIKNKNEIQPVTNNKNNKKQNLIEELFGYDYNTIMTDNKEDKINTKKKPKFKRKRRRR